MFVPSQQKLFFYRPRQAHYYDPKNNGGQRLNVGGPLLLFVIDATACHDPKRDRIYIGGGAYPVAKGPNGLWIFDVATDNWVDLGPAGSPAGNHFGTNVAVMTCDPRVDRVHLFRHSGDERAFIYTMLLI